MQSKKNQNEIFNEKIQEIYEKINISKDNISKYINNKKKSISRILLVLSQENNTYNTTLNSNIINYENQTILEKILENEKNFINYFYNKIISQNEKKEIINYIINKYKKISGISISKTINKELKITFNFCEELLNNKIKFFIILSILTEENYKLIEYSPKNINYEFYLLELNLTKNLTNFLCKIINNELIPFIRNK